MLNKINQLKQSAFSEIDQISDIKAAEKIKNAYLGRKGSIAALFEKFKILPVEDKKNHGKLLNDLKTDIENALKNKIENINKASESGKTPAKTIDVTIPGKRITRGSLSIITQIMDEMLEIFSSLGYTIAVGPEIETDYYNFEALNIPENHPSRDMWSTFYIEGGKLLRTHTSPVQIRFMEKNKPPFASVFPGRVFRRDAADLTHLPVFHQLEGLAVGKDITFQDLKGTLTYFLQKMFGKDRKVRFRPSYFPFTEPSAEVDVECFICEGAGCQICKKSGWLEILGCGMVDPNVFEAVKYDPEEVSGFAFGVGIERIAMLKYGIDDIRLFFENDLRFIKQF